nr:putative beta-D-galactosidase [Oryza sativa Japonica Group]
MAGASSYFSLRRLLLLLLPLVPLLGATTAAAAGANSSVTYDHRSLIISGRRRLLISTSIHYPRSVPEMWPKLVAEAKDGGADCVETYVFWNGHEPAQGQVRAASPKFVMDLACSIRDKPYYFEERFDLVRFAKIVKDAGLYMILRIGPFVAAEWTFGGVPVWLHYAPGTVFRTNNEPFKSHMKRFTTYIVDMMKKEQFFASQGGHIILAQVENEYGDMEQAYGAGAKPYAMWAASMALAQNTGVPWIMCQQYDAPDPVINTCNSFYCDQFKPNSPTKPKFWTENWPGWFQTFGESNPHRPPEDVAFSVARFFGKGGSLQNYYVADVYTDQSGGCVAFLSNVDSEKDKVVTFQSRSYDLPAWSVSILPDCKNVAFNTAKVRSQTLMMDMVPANLESSKVDGWSIFREKYGIWGNIDLVRNGFVDHINTTKDSTDYLWYTTSFDVDGSHLAGGNHVLHIESKGHAVQAFLNNELIGSAYGNGSKSNFSVEMPVNLRAGKNKLSLLSMTVGLQNGGPMYEWAGAGITSVKISGMENRIIDLSSNKWEYKVNVDVPQGDDPVGLDMQSMGKGLAWLNGNAIGRYWPRISPVSDRCTSSCDYRGTFSPNKCRRGCGQPTQRWYHVPRSWFHPSGNTLVIFEEKGGDPTKITFSRRTVASVCSFVSEHYPSIDLESWDRNTQNDGRDAAKVQLSCPKGKSISSVKFVSFGNPSGTCRSYQQGSCHHPNSISVVEKGTLGWAHRRACLNMNGCTVSLSDEGFGEDLCPGVTKTLAIEADCS